MNSRTLTNLSLLAAVGALALLAIYRPGIHPPPPLPHLTRRHADQVQHIRIESGQHRLELERRQGRWVIRHQPPIPADRVAVDRLLGLLQQPYKRSYGTGEVKLKTLGLDPPRSRVHFDDLTMDFGNTDPLGSLRYVRIGKRVYLILDSVATLRNARPSSLASPRLLPGKASPQRIRLPDLSLQRDAKGQWRVAPERPGVGADQIQALVDAWRETRAQWLTDLAPEQKKGAEKAGKGVDIDLGQAQIHFDIGTRLLRRPDLGLEYHLGEAQMKALLQLQPAAEPEKTKQAHPGTKAATPGKQPAPAHPGGGH